MAENRARVEDDDDRVVPGSFISETKTKIVKMIPAGKNCPRVLENFSPMAPKNYFSAEPKTFV